MHFARNWVLSILFSLLGAVSFADSTLSDGPHISFVGKDRIPNLKFNNVEPLNDREVVLKGSFKSAGWKLFIEFEGVPINIGLDGAFVRRVQLTGRNTLVPFIAVNKDGETQKQSIYVVSPQYSATKMGAVDGKWLNYLVSLGLSQLKFQDSFGNQFRQIAITPKVGFVYRLPNAPRWKVTSNVFLTALSLSQSEYSKPVSVRYLGANLKAGYETGWLGPKWNFEIQAGWYYSTMFVTNRYFGYARVNGPQVYPVIEYEFGRGKKLGTFFKYSPVASGIQLLPLDGSNEMATGLSYRFPVQWVSDGTLQFSLDYSALKLKINQSDYIQIQSTTFGVGLGF